MIKTMLAMSMTSLLWATPAMAGEPTNNGVVRVKSDYSVDVTAQRLASSIEAKGLKLFTEIDHAAGAQSVGQSLPPTRLLVFGNPKVGTPLMQCDRTVAIDLPQKALIWEDQAGQVWVGYNNPQYLQARHDLKDCGPVISKVETVLRALVTSATQPSQSSGR